MIAFNFKFDECPLAAPDPVFLHGFDRQRPVYSVKPFQQAISISGNFEKPLLQLFGRHAGAATFAIAVYHLLPRQNSLARRAPINRRQLSISQTIFIHQQKKPLRPFVIFRLASGNFPRPIIRKTDGFNLAAEGGNICPRRFARVHAGFDSIVLGREPKGVKTHRVQNGLALHSQITGVNIGRCVAFRVPHMQSGTRRVREHIQNVNPVFARDLRILFYLV